jgi:hypothetical protein
MMGRRDKDRRGQETGQERTGEDRRGQERTGEDRRGQERTGEDRREYDWTTGQETGQERTGQHKRARNGSQQRNTGGDVLAEVPLPTTVLPPTTMG